MRRYQPEAQPLGTCSVHQFQDTQRRYPLQLTSADQVTIDFSGGDQETVQTALLYQYRLLPVAKGLANDHVLTHHVRFAR